MVDAFGEDVELASILLNDCLGDHETESNSVVVHLRGSKQFAKLVAKLWNLLQGYPSPTVTHLNFEKFSCLVIANQNANVASLGELEGILDQVDQDLLQAQLITV